MVTDKIKQKLKDGTEITVDIGAKAANVKTDADHQFVTATEKAAIKSGSEVSQDVSNKIGETGDTGGSTTAGSAFGKLNKLISDLATHMSRWSSTRAGYIDVINTNAASAKTDAEAAKTNTAINNTASATGTLSQKLSHVIDLMGSKGAVKSVQTGIFSILKSNKIDGSICNFAIDITINTVNPDKSMVLIDAIISADLATCSCILESLTATSIRIGSKMAKSDTTIDHVSGSWQVIEFY